MRSDEEQFEDFINNIKFDDTPDHSHRDKLEQNLLRVIAKTSRRPNSTREIWRTIMNSKMTKLCTAAAVLILVGIVSWFSSKPSSNQQISSFSLLARACAAEQTLFYGTDGITHIANEIVLYPGQERDAGELLNDLEAEVTQDKNIAFVKSWLSHRWLPIYSLGADGQLREHKLGPAKHTDRTVTVSDLAWYDTATGRFARVLKIGDQVLFANAYDGESVYLATKSPEGALRIKQELVTDEFQMPNNPADFLGIAAGITGSIPKEHYPPIQEVTSETLDDGTPVRVYKLGFADPWGKVDTYFSFKISTDADVITEIECVVDGETTSVHRRTVAETVDSSEISWNLSELNVSPVGYISAKIDSDAGINIVTIQQMSQRANSPVYVFETDPSWTYDRKIYDLPDEMSAPARIFVATYPAKDGRDVVLCQGETFTRYFSAIDKALELGNQVPWTYESENGFKALHQDDKEGEMWWTEFALKSSGFEPRANRVGYILMSPARAFMVLAINGPVSEQELQSLIDSLIPANQYVPSSVQPPSQ